MIAVMMRLADVRLGYGRGPDVLRGIDLDVPAGRSTVLLGGNGQASRRSRSNLLKHA